MFFSNMLHALLILAVAAAMFWLIGTLSEAIIPTPETLISEMR